MTRYYEDTDPAMEREAEEEELRDRRADADAEMAAMNRAGNAIARAERAGICTHGSAAGYLPPGQECCPEQHGLLPGQLACTKNTGGCVRVFDNDEDWYAAMDAAIAGI